MRTGQIIFISVALLNIISLADKWIVTKDPQMTGILGWICAIALDLEFK
jgi:hypothetical protein